MTTGTSVYKLGEFEVDFTLRVLKDWLILIEFFIHFMRLIREETALWFIDFYINGSY